MKKHWIRICAIALVLCCIFAAVTGCAGSAEAEAKPKTVVREKIQPRDGLQTILVFCVDEADTPQDKTAYRNGKTVDLLLVMVMDTVAGKTRALQINPDTLISYTPQGTKEALQLPLGQVYSYGSGGSDSGQAQMKEMSRFLGGLPMDHYLTFSMDAVAVVNDYIGCVELPMPEGLETVFPEVQAGAQYHLAGQEVMDFLRYRGTKDVSNEEKMLRQRKYMMEMLPTLFEKAKDEDFLTKLTVKLGEGMATDLTLSQMVQVLDLMAGFELDTNVVTIPGEGSLEDGTYHFTPDADAMNGILDELFCE